METYTPERVKNYMQAGYTQTEATLAAIEMALEHIKRCLTRIEAKMDKGKDN